MVNEQRNLFEYICVSAFFIVIALGGIATFSRPQYWKYGIYKTKEFNKQVFAVCIGLLFMLAVYLFFAQQALISILLFTIICLGVYCLFKQIYKKFPKIDKLFNAMA